MISSSDIHNAKVMIVDDQEANVRQLDLLMPGMYGFQVMEGLN